MALSSLVKVENFFNFYCGLLAAGYGLEIFM